MMGIYIDDVDMPKTCHECQMLEGDPSDGLCHAANKWLDDDYFRWYQYDEEDFDYSKPLNCPIIKASFNDVENVAYHYKDRIAGYEIRDLVLVTETLRKHNIKPQDLRLHGDAYVKGWEDCERYHDAIMQQVVSDMKDNINAFAEGGKKP